MSISIISPLPRAEDDTSLLCESAKITCESKTFKEGQIIAIVVRIHTENQKSMSRGEHQLCLDLDWLPTTFEMHDSDCF